MRAVSTLVALPLSVLRQAQDEVLSSWHFADAILDVPHPEPVEGRTAVLRQ
jgi:hypothetical protein